MKLENDIAKIQKPQPSSSKKRATSFGNKRVNFSKKDLKKQAKILGRNDGLKSIKSLALNLMSLSEKPSTRPTTAAIKQPEYSVNIEV